MREIRDLYKVVTVKSIDDKYEDEKYFRISDLVELLTEEETFVTLHKSQ